MQGIGNDVKPVAAFYPEQSAVTPTPIAIDRRGFGSGVLTLLAGAVTGTPDSLTATPTLTECATSDGAFTAVDTSRYTVSGTITAAGTQKVEVNVDLRACLRYIKFGVTLVFVGGSSPKVFLVGLAVLGDPDVKPV